MTLDDIKNNDLLVRRIKKSILKGNIPHAYIFEGGAETDKKALADSFAKALLCKAHPGTGCFSCIVCGKIGHGNYEDIIYAEKDGDSVKDEAIWILQERLRRKPYAGERNIAIINNADTMTKRAQNRLLKTLEEPPPGAVIILLSENTENLAKTIVSRCAVLRWAPFAGDEVIVFEEAEAPVKMILKGAPFYRIKSKVMELADGRDEAYRLLDSMELLFGSYLRENLCGGRAVCSAIGAIENARRDLKRGMSVSYTLKNMILKMEEKQW